MINANYYDIESLANLFTLANFKDNEDPSKAVVDIYFLCDDEDKILCEPDWQSKLLDHIYLKNRNYMGKVRFLNLKQEASVVELSKTFGVSDARFMNDPKAKNNFRDYFRIVCDTDPDYDENIHPYLLGYNSYNYDTTMLAEYFSRVWSVKFRDIQKSNKIVSSCVFNPNVTAKEMREFNDVLFTKQYKNSMSSALTVDASGNRDYQQTSYKIRKNMLMSGRHLDVARLNEKMTKVALKRLLGMLGLQIFESRKLHGTNITVQTPEEFYELMAYNISDVVNLKPLFMHKLYQGQFSLKKGLLQTYPELIYEEKGHTYKANISPKTVRSDRLCIDSSSAQFATKSLCPYNNLKDIPYVSFNYPSVNQAKEMGVEQVNVLEETKKFFYNLYPQPEIRAEFDKIYNFYKSIEGKNFNDSLAYQEEYVKNGVDYPYGKHSISEISKADTCIPYYDKDGNPTSCFVLFGVGGIHGAEYNKPLLEYDTRLWEQEMADMNEVQTQFPDPVDLRKAKTVTMADGRELSYNQFLKGGKKIADSEYKDIVSKKPLLFRENKRGSFELNKKYVYTSVCKVNHEDFTSYYPNLLRRMEAFFNKGLGYDRYADIFQQKQDYGFLMKEKNANLTPELAKKYAHRRMQGVNPKCLTISDEERAHYSVLREGTKLILNSASGAADATFENNIRVNNQIISMRIIGQLFSYRIGQAQSYEGAIIPSTNTDGLYSVMEKNLNNEILARESANIGVEIEPEPMYFVSKDSNNRIEIGPNMRTILGAGGGSVGCRKGPTPTKSLAHPAIIDWALSEYLTMAVDENSEIKINEPFNRAAGFSILQSAFNIFKPVDCLIRFQNIIASSPGTINYIYGVCEDNPEPIVLQHYNRMFIMKDGTPNTMHLYSACARKITPAMAKKRKENDERPVATPDPIAKKVLLENGEVVTNIQRDIVTKKVTGISPKLNILIDNHNLSELSKSEQNYILDNLDLKAYLDMLDSSYTKNWMNKVPGIIYTEDAEYDIDDIDEIDDET